ncbi:AbrB/MazE/SpoVT family DNA-binding domain-containing protein [Mesorhizobium sp. NBSH29]|uniref:antitoxin n=1 Tax=Mesorhizobium sp. NBSH29 TaxID=2654249 RepID=UPI0018964A18|nr:AbrB/MazE/SpoVT family DNA-binding domain-containing protein [Mesorhizobium sp. NBSH29]QPC85465.1 AbrB/MazE/SpoVT family DNA-binding domain-containing protein [Mesorhizobium sp. NBSH29]
MNTHEKNTRTASLFRNGRSQAVRIPKEFEFEGDEVLVSRGEDGALRLEPKPSQKSLVDVLDWLAQQPPFDEQMPEIEDFPPEPVDLEDKG